jgi:ATP-dependent RNA helicase RhlE
MNDKTFESLGVSEPIRRALADENYTTPTPIQAQAIPLLTQGCDLIGIAQTGTGKTAAFALPILQALAADRRPPLKRKAKALILAPTRELAIQIADGFRTYGRHLQLRQATIFGGVSQHGQVKAMARGVDILVATPGRLLDLVEQDHVWLDAVTHLVLDEADRMLDMGFIRDIRKIVEMLPNRRQSMMFSATMPAEVEKLAREMLHDPERISVTPKQVAVERIDQRVYFVDTPDKRGLLESLLSDPKGGIDRVIVFTRTKHRANRVAEQLERAGIPAEALHGNKSQGARQRAMNRFRSGEARVLVATDIAARGIDVDDVTHVINYELPNEPESYVHRIGRTARAGADGIALSFCDASERGYLRDIERLTKRPMLVAAGERGAEAAPREARKPQGARKPRRAQPGRPKRPQHAGGQKSDKAQPGAGPGRKADKAPRPASRRKRRNRPGRDRRAA